MSEAKSRWPSKFQGELLGITEYFPEDYAPTGDICSGDDDLLEDIKDIIQTKLSEAERRLFLLYVEKGCRYARVARALNVAPANYRNYILRIKARIINELQSRGHDTESLPY